MVVFAILKMYFYIRVVGNFAISLVRSEWPAKPQDQKVFSMHFLGPYVKHENTSAHWFLSRSTLLKCCFWIRFCDRILICLVIPSIAHAKVAYLTIYCFMWPYLSRSDQVYYYSLVYDLIHCLSKKIFEWHLHMRMTYSICAQISQFCLLASRCV